MPTQLGMSQRVARVVTVAKLVPLVVGGVVLLIGHAPLVVAIAASFATPLVFAAFVFGARWLGVAFRGQRRLPTPPRRPGSMQPRPFSPAQRRRPHT